MVEKCFKIISNSEQYLNAETVAEALLHYFTLDPTKPDVAFGVIEASSKSKEVKTANTSS